jgi:alpha-beta hydrolase superfamily lysophospholipase
MEWTTTVETGDGAKLSVQLFKPPASGEEPDPGEDVAVVLVHPYTILGGKQDQLSGMAEGVARRGYSAVTFDMRGAGRSTGCPSLTGSTEVRDVVAVCRWVAENTSRAASSSSDTPLVGGETLSRSIPFSVHGSVKPSHRQTAAAISQIDQTISPF